MNPWFDVMGHIYFIFIYVSMHKQIYSFGLYFSDLCVQITDQNGT